MTVSRERDLGSVRRSRTGQTKDCLTYHFPRAQAPRDSDEGGEEEKVYDMQMPDDLRNGNAGSSLAEGYGLWSGESGEACVDLGVRSSVTLEW